MAFVELASESAVHTALRLHHSVMSGRRINVERTVGGGGAAGDRKAKLGELRELQGNQMVATVKQLCESILPAEGDEPEAVPESDDVEDADGNVAYERVTRADVDERGAAARARAHSNRAGAHSNRAGAHSNRAGAHSQPGWRALQPGWRALQPSWRALQPSWRALQPGCRALQPGRAARPARTPAQAKGGRALRPRRNAGAHSSPGGRPARPITPIGRDAIRRCRTPAVRSPDACTR
eukprot:3994553-Prymnesium_polylepis.1